MARRKKFAIFAAAGLALALVGALIYQMSRPEQVAFLSGAVLREDSDPQKQRPIENAVITAASGVASGKASSDGSGHFRLRMQPPVESGQPVLLAFDHPDYHLVKLTTPATDQIQVVRMAPKSPDTVPPAEEPSIAISAVHVRYALKSTSTVNIGSVAKTFEVVNTGNVPCNDKPPCSPNGKWKAAVGSLELDAGDNNEFRNVRVSCLAGPCPFTTIESDGFSAGGRNINVSVRNWSDTVTYVLEAEVAQTMATDMIRRSYPVIFGRSMSFTLPAAAQGPSIEAEVDGSEIVFPLGPSLILSWADCSLETGADQIKLYRCELKPKYRFE